MNNITSEYRRKYAATFPKQIWQEIGSVRDKEVEDHARLPEAMLSIVKFSQILETRRRASSASFSAASYTRMRGRVEGEIQYGGSCARMVENFGCIFCSLEALAHSHLVPFGCAEQISNAKLFKRS